MKGGNPLKNKGYTIVEVMIVLAVSGVLFVIAANFIGDRQAKTAFTQGVNGLAAQLQTTIDDVVDGKYSDIALSCQSPSGNVSINPNVALAKEQGTNAPCVFRGKLIHFYGPTSDHSKYEVIPLVDLRSPPTSSAQDLVRINSHSSLVQQNNVPQKLDVSRATVVPTSGPNTNAYNIGFLQSSGVRNESNTGYKSGSQTIRLVYVPAGPGMPTTSAASPSGLAGKVANAKSFEMCVSDGTRHATITVGANGNGQLTVATKMRGTTAC